MLVRLVVVLAPVFGIATGGFALLHLYGSVVAIRQGSIPFALLYGALGVAGIALSLALWRIRRQVLRRAA